MEFSKEMTFENYMRKHTVQVLKSLSMELSLLFFPNFNKLRFEVDGINN